MMHRIQTAILFTDYAAPFRKALGRMLIHPLGELRGAHQTGLHGDVNEVGCQLAIERAILLLGLDWAFLCKLTRVWRP